MAEADFTVMTSSLATSSIDRGVSGGITPPSGGSSFVYGFNALDATPGAAALRYNAANFNPMAKGGIITGALRRGSQGGGAGASAFLFLCAQNDTIAANAYMLGLSDEAAPRIQLRKGALQAGLVASAVTIPPTDGVLAYSDDAVALNTWVHLRLDAILNENGDVVLNCYRNDLTLYAVSAPVWVPIPGIARFIDDTLGAVTGTPPNAGGRVGFGFAKSGSTRQGFVDYLQIYRQP